MAAPKITDAMVEAGVRTIHNVFYDAGWTVPDSPNVKQVAFQVFWAMSKAAPDMEWVRRGEQSDEQWLALGIDPITKEKRNPVFRTDERRWAHAMVDLRCRREGLGSLDPLVDDVCHYDRGP